MRVVTGEAAAVEVVIAAIIGRANRNLFSEIWNRMKSPQSRRLMPYTFHAFLSPLWESIWHRWAQSLSINTCSIGWLSLETHRNLAVSSRTYTYPGRMHSVRLPSRALRWAMQVDHGNVHTGNKSLRSQEHRGTSPFTSTAGDGVLLGKHKNANHGKNFKTAE